MRSSGGATELGQYAPVGKEDELGDYDSKDVDEGEVDLDNPISFSDIKDGSSTFAETQLLRKIDRRIMPCLILMIILNYLDRNALANARVQGIEKSLGLVGSQFNTAVSIFFVGYIGLQIPSNMLLTRVRPSIYLPGCMIAWGLLSGTTAFVNGFHGLVIVRFFLGMVEAPFFPGALFLLSSWYTKEELAFRTSLLYSGSLVAGAFGGFVGAGIEYDLKGVLHMASWRWLFLIEATSTVILAICAIFILPDYPHTTRWLTPEERALAVSRIQSHSGMQDKKRGSLLLGLKLALVDPKVWLLALIIITKTSAGAVTSFIPTLVATFDLSPVSTLLLVAPPYLAAAATALAVSYSSDKRSERSYHILLPIFLAMFGFLVFGSTLAPLPRYLSMFLMLAGIYGSYNVALAWISSTLPHPVEKRSAAIAIINTVGNMAQIYSPFFYLKENGPRYLGAMIANGGFCLACLGAVWALRQYLRKENVKIDRGEKLGLGRGFKYVI